ncbi:DUF2892 domain-containing protein [bacterium]|nr:DUF2892 domain-containing protein [bacterium]
MKKNVGSADRIIRIIAAIAFALLYLTNTVSGTLGIVLLVVGIVLFLTAVINFCPLYFPFGISTRPKK